MGVTEFRLHLWSRLPGHQIPSASFDAPSTLHGAALALREFLRLGRDITVPGAHLDVSESDGRSHTMMISEVLDWLHGPEQAAFVREQDLASLLEVVPPSQI